MTIALTIPTQNCPTLPFVDAAYGDMLLSMRGAKDSQMDQLTLIKTDPDLVLDAFFRLRLQNEDSNTAFRERLRAFAMDHCVKEVSSVLRGLSASSIKSMRRRQAKVPPALPRILVSFLFLETQIDVTRQQYLAAFHQLGFDIQLSINVETRNVEDSLHDVHDLKNFTLELHEANATAEDPEVRDFELDLRVGFDRTRLTLRAKDLRPLGNHLAAETPGMPNERLEPDYSGWFRMRLKSRNPPSWVFDPINEGTVLAGRVDAEFLGRIETARGASLVAEITARRDALKVRIIDEDGGRCASKSLSEKHRDKMCAAVVRKSFAGAADEFLVHRMLLVSGDQNRRDKASS